MWASLTNTALRGVAIALAAVALLGFYLGIRGALPSGATVAETGLPAAVANGPVQEVQPIQDVVPPPPAPEPKAEAANAAAANAAAEQEEEPPPPAKIVPRAPPQTNIVEPQDPIGNLISPPQKAEEPPILY